MKLIIILTTFIILLGSQSEAQVKKIVGGQVECNPNNAGCLRFPTEAVLLCDGDLNCPQFFHPDWTDSTGLRFYGITNRINPGIFIQSLDGGITWTPITTQPFDTPVLNFGIRMAVASDGSLLAASGQGTNTCIIRRSTDGGINWITVFTSTTLQCSILLSSPTTPGMYCAESGGYCVIIPDDNLVLVPIYSTNFGQTWIVGTQSNLTATDPRAYGPILLSDGSQGRVFRGINPPSGKPFGIQVGFDYILTGNYIPPYTVNCRPLLMGLNFRGLCTKNGISDPILRYINPDMIPLEIRTLSLGSILPSGQEIMPLGYSATIGYIALVDVAFIDKITILVSVDDFISITLLTRLTPKTAPFSGMCCRGNTIKFKNKLYFSSGVSDAYAFLAVIR